MKVRVYESDGVFQGGLLKLDVFNALTCRMWHARPDPRIQEFLIDISTFKEATSRYSWFRVSLPKREPNGPWPRLEDDEFDPDAQAYRLRPREAQMWFQKRGFIPPDDLVEICRLEEDDNSRPSQGTGEPYMPAKWFADEYGIPSERLRSAQRTGRLRAHKEGNRWMYSVPDAARIWPEDEIKIPVNPG